uniref:BHLH domain-containing protein n=1 Tax=Panagrolaimus sp. JU765 TaxID=591449 RepID=A0AC34QFY4_9BILA
MNQSDRKKQTHLRCERQRREAINSGYNELKDLLPPNSSFVGCKTTNAAILFRAADYVKHLNEEIKKDEDELTKLQTQLSALELIAQQYETFSNDSEPDSPHLNEEIKKDEDELTKLQTQLSALELIAQQYETFSNDSEPDSPVQIEMMKKFLDSCFETFSKTFNDKDYPSITKTLLSWVETANLKKPGEDMIGVAKHIKKER